MNLLGAHHDGSELYVSNSAPNIGEFVELKVRIPIKDRPTQVFVRLFHDGEPRTFELKKVKSGKFETWWSTKVEIFNTVTRYRFMLVDKESYRWLNGLGVFSHDVTDREDFQIIAKPAYPKWIKSAVFYQIFPDRFAKSETVRKLPDWAIPREWNELPKGRDKSTGVEFYGGDLPGITSKLAHIADLGATAIYFTPAFPGRSNHRYDASSFDEIDPLLGGNSAMIEFSNSAHAAGFKIMGDLTTNHCGLGHRWIQKALKNPRARSRQFYWDKKISHGYVGWWGLASLPKLNYTSIKLRELMYSGKNSVIRKWLNPPFNFDGWRIDVGNMTGRYLGQDINQEISRGIRKAMDDANPQAWLVAENADHSPTDLDGLGWHGTMNYNGFARPLAHWLNKPKKDIPNFSQFSVPNPIFSGEGTVAVMRAFAAGIPWRSLTASMVLLDSHDTARFKTVVGGDRQRHIAAVTALLTYPGVPSIFAGDEIGLEGEWGEDARRTIDWDQPIEWDVDLFAEFKELVRIRKNHDALINGGIRWLYSSENAFAYLRESKKEAVLVFISRSAGSHQLDLSKLGLRIDKTLFGSAQSGSKIAIRSRNATSGIWLLK